MVPSSHFDVASEDVGHSKRDDDLQFTEWTWLYADRAHMCTRIIKVAARETPQVLRNRRVKCRSLGKPRVGRACSLLNRCIAEVFLGPLCQDLSNQYIGGSIRAHGSLRGDERCPCTVRYNRTSFNTIIDVLILVQVWKEDMIGGAMALSS